MTGDTSWRSSEQVATLLAARLENCPGIHDVVALDNASMPVIKLQVQTARDRGHYPSTLHSMVPFTMESPPLHSRSLLHYLPNVGPVVRLLKHLFRSAGFSDPYTGGIQLTR